MYSNRETLKQRKRDRDQETDPERQKKEIETENKLGLSCAKLRSAWASYQLAFVLLAFTEAAYYA